MLDAARSQLAPSGTLRAAINTGNFLLVTGSDPAGNPTGVAPSLAGAIAARLGVPLRTVPFATPGQIADTAGTGVWDICLIGAEPARAALIEFTPAYVEIEATYLVPGGSTLRTVDDVDAPGIRIAVTARTAYDLWLERMIRHATLVRSDSLDSACVQFVADGLEALAGLRPRLLTDLATLPGTRILPGRFTAVQQAVGTLRENGAGAAFLHSFVEEAKVSGVIEGFIKAHGVQGLSLAPPA